MGDETTRELLEELEQQVRRITGEAVESKKREKDWNSKKKEAKKLLSGIIKKIEEFGNGG